VFDTGISGCPFHPLLVPDEHHLDVRPKRAPALDRVALNLGDVAAKRLGDGEDRQHRVESTAGPGVRPALPYDGGCDGADIEMTTRIARTLARRLRSRTAGEGDRTAGDLPVHFFTIVLNGEPFIRYHLDVFRRLGFRWHWHVIEGVASLVRDTAWSVAAGGYIDSAAHACGLSVDGTTTYLDEIAADDPQRISIYRKPAGSFWAGKREMVSAPLKNIREVCLLWEVDADELWTSEQIASMRQLFLDQPDRTAARYWCHYVPAPGAVIATRYNYAANPKVDWLRTWRYRPGDKWQAHEPPILVRRARGRSIDVGKKHPFLHDETEDAGAVFQHFAYATEEQVRFKETYYGYSRAPERWWELRNAVRGARGPLRLGDYLPWVPDDTLVDDAARRHVPLLAHEQDDGSWSFSRGTTGSAAAATPSREGVIVVDGVFFQHFLNSGIARVWRSYLREWVKTGFAERVVFLDRGGAGPRLPGLPTRSIPPWRDYLTAQDSFRLQRICDEERVALFVSTYYTTPIATPSAMLVYDLIPERLGLDMSDQVWEEKRFAIEHASAYACISENTRRDLLELESASSGKRADVVPLGVDESFTVAAERDVAAFRAEHRLDRPYFLVVGERQGVDGYKNVELVFRALRDWPEADAHELVCVGGLSDIEPDLRAIAPRMRVRRLALSDEELRLAYAGAVALLFPSRYEGFGLPIAEAMACGCPVITTALSSLPDVAGDAAIYIDPDDPRSLKEAFTIVRDPDRRAAMIAAGEKRAEALTWAEAASAFAAALSAAAAADTADQRQAREGIWAARRHAQNRTQQALAASRPPEPDLHERPQQEDHRAVPGLKGLALRHLPSWAIAVLRVVYGSLYNRFWRLRRVFATK
jgi:glycosyltransferase involved in cell wall biosynthesis